MNKIVAISDLHLGQTGSDKLGQYSLLSSRAPGNMVDVFASAVAGYAGAERFTLLIAGDGLDLSVSYAEDALADLRDLLAALARAGACPHEIVYVIGNHDHHLWSLHSEDKRLLSSLRAGRVPNSPDGVATKSVYQITSRDGEPFAILQPLVDEVFGQGKASIAIAYPSYVRALGDGSRLYVTHGHLFGGLYTELSDLLAPTLVGLPRDRVAATVNHPIIELLYWQIGETGEGIGADGLVEKIYTDLQKGTLSKVQGLVARIVAQILPRGVLWRALGNLERRIIVAAIMAELDKSLLPTSTNASADRHAELEATRASLLAWLRADNSASADTIQDKTVVVYGHTHVRDDYQIPDTGVQSYNLGTWLVEPNHDAPSTGFLGIDATGKPAWIGVTK